MSAYRTSSTRRSRAEIEKLRVTLYDLLEADHPMSVRQVFYQMVTMSVIDKTEAEYRGTVCRLLAEMRRSKRIPYRWLADSTRWMRKGTTFDTMEEALRITAETYRKSLWTTADAYVEVWLEKDALAGVLYPETNEFDVPLMVTRGYPSLSFLDSAAESIADQDRPCHLYYFGDYDPSGVDIPRAVEQGLREMAPDAEIHFERVAVNPDQIRKMRLPTRPTKKTDSRSKNFTGESVEVDAIPAATLRTLVRNRIARHLDAEEVGRLEVVEAQERATLTSMWSAFRGHEATS
jgi:hypothetical protein